MQFQNMEKWEDSTSFLRGKNNLSKKDKNQNTSDFSQNWKLENNGKMSLRLWKKIISNLQFYT